MTASSSLRDHGRRSCLAIALRFVVPLLWLALLGYQWAFASMVLADVSQIVAQRFAFDTRTVPAPVWGVLCDAYGSLNLFSWSLWLAACPRVLTAVLAGETNLAWAQRRLARGVLFVALIGLAIQGIWLIAILQLHGADVNMSDYVFRRMLTYLETHLAWHWQLVALLPLMTWFGVLSLGRESIHNPYHWIAGGWAAFVFVELNVAFGLGQARFLSDHSFGFGDRMDIVARYAVIAVVTVALLAEYRQVWQCNWADFSKGPTDEPLAVSPQSPAPSP